MKKDFPTLAVLSVTTGRLLTQPKEPREGNGIGHMYELLGWMTDDSPFTHQLPRFCDECKPHIYKQRPDLAEVESEIVRRCEAGEVKDVQRDMLARFGETILLERIPAESHQVENPIAELASMMTKDCDSRVRQ